MMRMVNEPTQVTVTHSGPVFSVERLEWIDGSSRIVKDVVRHPGAVTVIGELDDGRLVLIRNHRVAVGASLLEFCAGKREPAEEPSVEHWFSGALEAGAAPGTLFFDWIVQQD